ncbi:tyrosine-protein kinase Fer [Grus japonensis]|uniref:Tyrosine-protein kinase Fer n=1 Tax=Grus japonensis TaxID=30415 RepID=A0ABC9YGM8_GRUJA
MGFGSDLKYSHDALLKLQDWELRLLETVKKFMVMRVKSDKEYASTLQNLCNQIDKESTCQLDYISNVSKIHLSHFDLGSLIHLLVLLMFLSSGPTLEYVGIYMTYLYN